LALLVAAALVLACSAPEPEQRRGPRMPPPAPREAPVFPTPAGQPAFAPVVSRRQQIRLYLPDRGGWRQRHERSSFLVLVHPDSHSRLVVRVWREPENMNRARCEAQARLARELPVRGQRVDRAELDVPRGFDTVVDTGVVDTGLHDTLADRPTAGYLLAFGASVKRCVALVFTTEAMGSGAERAVGERLAVARSLIVGKLELLSDIPR